MFWGCQLIMDASLLAKGIQLFHILPGFHCKKMYSIDIKYFKTQENTLLTTYSFCFPFVPLIV